MSAQNSGKSLGSRGSAVPIPAVSSQRSPDPLTGAEGVYCSIPKPTLALGLRPRQPAQQSSFPYA